MRVVSRSAADAVSAGAQWQWTFLSWLRLPPRWVLPQRWPSPDDEAIPEEVQAEKRLDTAADTHEAQDIVPGSLAPDYSGSVDDDSEVGSAGGRGGMAPAWKLECRQDCRSELDPEAESAVCVYLSRTHIKSKGWWWW